MESKKKWKIYVIHHTHTDVGYTDRQERIRKYHADFIREAVDIVNKSKDCPGWRGFKWTCESFWSVESFLKRANRQEKELFDQAVKSKDIEFSASYLCMTDLVDYDVFKSITSRSVEYGKALGIGVKSAMAADVNGFAWGYAQALADLGIENLYFCVHTHHGMFPAGKTQIPFLWEAPDGKKILVWSSDHYHIGNELGLVPNQMLSYSIKDDLSRKDFDGGQMAFVEKRLGDYLNRLEQEGYPYDFFPITVHGTISDNAPPNPEIMSFIHQWNAKHGNEIEMEMTTLTPFFEHLRRQAAPIPVYRGDWPDWWCDGLGSNAKHLKIFNQAQRTMELVKRLDPKGEMLEVEKLRQAEYNLMLFAEHTAGHSASVSEPFDSFVNLMEARKNAYASEASRLAFEMLDDVVAAKGELPLTAIRPLRYKVMNPFPYRISDIVYLVVDFWEASAIEKGIEVIDEETGTVLEHQVQDFSRGKCICAYMGLEPGQEKIIRIKAAASGSDIASKPSGLTGVDGVTDIKPLPDDAAGNFHGVSLSETGLETPYVRIAWERGKGITSWVEKTTGCELIDREAAYTAFAPVYEILPVARTENTGEEMCTARRKMGRNRKALNTERFIGNMIGVSKGRKGNLFTGVELKYEIPGCGCYSVHLLAYANMPRVDVTVRVQKDIVWDPENLFIALPFTAGKEQQLWFNKADALFRPWKDQIPGTCVDFYCIQQGIVMEGDRCGLAIAMPDTNIVQTGALEYQERLLSGHPELEKRKPFLYSWVLNNFWETNFKASTEGFYEFRYFLQWGESLKDPEKAMQACRAANTGLSCFRA